ncbi:MAG: prolipoprotein diacylglyceryl transferase [Oscillospiraceae bacterium]|nr:prolipoprotein diacylglyceryl transferase [Oscillospiraceae bacterium]
MNPVALFIGGHTIFWNAIVIALGAAACFFLTMSLFTAHGGKAVAVWLLLPLGVALSLVFARAIHWYCHSEQYASFKAAVTDYSAGGYCLFGAVLGVALAGLIVRALGFTQNLRRLYDCLAPGAALGVALIRLSDLFTVANRGKIVIDDPTFQRLPFATRLSTANGAEEWRFASFFLQFLLMLLVFVLLLRFFTRRRRWPMKDGQPRDGNVALMFLAWFGAVDLVTDSMRYDSSFIPLNGFVSLVQIVSAAALLAVLVIYSVRSIRANGLRFYHWLLWLGFLLLLGGIGVMEYLVQRHGNWYLSCYLGMSACSFLITVIDGLCYRTVCRKR